MPGEAGSVRCNHLGHHVEGRRLSPADVIVDVIQPTAAVSDPNFYVIKNPCADLVRMGQ